MRPVEEFWKWRAGPGGLQTRCKDCLRNAKRDSRRRRKEPGSTQPYVSTSPGSVAEVLGTAADDIERGIAATAADVNRDIPSALTPWDPMRCDMHPDEWIVSDPPDRR